MIALFLSGTAPLLSIQTAENNLYSFYEADHNITSIDLNNAFEGQNDSFVLQNAAQDYDKEYATPRIPQLLPLKYQSFIPWNGQKYNLWNAYQE